MLESKFRERERERENYSLKLTEYDFVSSVNLGLTLVRLKKRGKKGIRGKKKIAGGLFKVR